MTILPSNETGSQAASETAVALSLPGQDQDQWLLATPTLRSGLLVELRRQGGKLVGVIEDKVRGKFFQIGNTEYHFLMMLDGKRSVAETVKAMQHGRGYSDFKEDNAKAICNWLSSVHLLETNGATNTDRLCQAANAKEKQRMVGWLNPVSFRIDLWNPDRALTKITPWFKFLFSWWMVAIWAASGLFAYSLVKADYDRFQAAASGILSNDRWLWLLVVWVVLKVIHEAAHGVACKKYGGEVPQAGMLVLLLAPLAYVNVTSSWRFASSRKRMVVSAAGMYVELFVAFAAAAVWYYSSSQFVADLAYNVIVMAGVSTVLFNANPLLRFDGYYLLSDALGIVNLYGKGQRWFGDRARSVLFGFPIDKNICPQSELRLVAIYGVCSFVWRILLSASLLLVASTLLEGVGLILAAIGGVFWVAMPVWQNVIKVRQVASTTPVNRRRVTFVSVCGLLFLVGAFYLFQAPASTRAPAIVQFKEEQAIRSAADGFVSMIYVSDGQTVKCGEPLIDIQNDQLLQQLNSLRQAVDVAQIQARIHGRRAERSLEQTELANVKSLNEQIEEMKTRVQRLQVVAPFDGVVFQRGLGNQLGNFVKQGDVLLHFANPSKKQIMVSIDQEQIRSVRGNEDQVVRFTFPGCKMVSAKFNSVEPRASEIPIDPSLTAAAGGPLMVRPSGQAQAGSEAEHVLVSPRFTAKCELMDESSSELAVGRRGTAFFHGRDMSLGSYAILQCRRWIREKLKLATQTAM